MAEKEKNMIDEAKMLNERAIRNLKKLKIATEDMKSLTLMELECWK